MDKKGILAFLAITFGITYAVEIAMLLAGMRFKPGLQITGQYVVFALMWVPALAAFITAKWITGEGLGGAYIRFGSWKPYLVTWLVFPLLFALIYALTWLLGFGQPDWNLVAFQSLFAATPGAQVPEIPAPTLVWPALFLASMVPTPLFNAFFGFGEELGWRGYLLPKLLPLGRLKTHLLLGVIWSLWHLPLVLAGFTYPGYPLAGALLFTILTIALGTLLDELTLHYRSSILAGWVHGVFNTQKLGAWALLFPTVHPLWGGYAGLIGLLVWGGVALWAWRWGKKQREKDA